MSLSNKMNATVQLAYRPTLLDRLTWWLARFGIRSRAIPAPSLEDISYHLQVKAMTLRHAATAREFQPILERAVSVSADAWSILATESGGRKVLVDNEYLKVVLIRWEPGFECPRHYHPNGGGMIMVLEGAIRESRFLNAVIARPYEERTLERHAMSYIDDHLGAHTVANTQANAAITLHAYLKYRPANG